VAEFLLDTEAASRLMRAERSVVANMRRSAARAMSISVPAESLIAMLFLHRLL
jgi:hypothetical protein